MKIAIVTDAIYPFTIGGSEIRNYEIAKRLVKKGHEVHIVGARFWKGESKISQDGVTIHGLQHYKQLYYKNGRRSLIDPVFLSVKIFFFLLKENFDVVDVASFTFLNCFAAKAACLFKKTKLVFTWHQYLGSYSLKYLGILVGSVAYLLEYISTKLTNNHIAVSDTTKKNLLKLGVSEKNIVVIQNGTDIKVVLEAKKREEVFDIIYVGRLHYQKNISLLIDVTAEIKKVIPNIQVCIIGEGPDKANIEEKIKSLRLNSNVHLKGIIEKKEKIFSYLKSSKVFVLTSKLEGFPLTIIESNACGLPIVATETENNAVERYLKENGISGFCVEAEVQSIAKKIIDMLKDNNLYETLSKNAIEKAKEFDWDILTDKIEKYYHSLVLN